MLQFTRLLIASILGLACILPQFSLAQAVPVTTTNNNIELVQARIELIQNTITTLARTIVNSNDLSDAERIALLRQVLVLSRALQDFQNIQVNSNLTNDDVLPDVSTTTVDRDTPIVATFDVETQTAEISIEQASGTPRTFTVTDLFDPAEVEGFQAQTEAVRIALVSQLRERLGMTALEVDRALLISGTDPDREIPVGRNRSLGEEYFEQIGQSSIVNFASVYPARGAEPARLVIGTDQEELIEVDIDRPTSGMSLSPFANQNYPLNIRVFFGIDRADINYSAEPGTMTDLGYYRYVGLTESTNDATIEDIREYLRLNQPAFAGAVDNFVNKFISFMINGSQGSVAGRLECMESSDWDVIESYLEFFLNEMDYQHYPVEDIIDRIRGVRNPVELPISTCPDSYF